MSTATYLYCLVRSAKEPSLRTAPPGLPGAGRPRAIDAGPGIDAAPGLETLLAREAERVR